MSNEPIILQLEPYDDAVSVRDRLGMLNNRYVILVWPRRAVILRRKLDLLLVQRRAAELGMQIVLVTGDPDVIDHARDLNISAFASVEAARYGNWKYARTRYFANPQDTAGQANRPPDQPLYKGWQRQARRWMLLLVVGLALVISFLLAAPSATITITPASDQVFVRVPVVADPDVTDIDIENYRMPAAAVTFQTSSHVTVQSSGRETAGASLSQGLVTVTNTTDEPILIPLGTIFVTSSTFPIRFETMIETTLPAGPGSSVNIPIQALPEHAGANGNVDPGTINRVEAAFADQINATNTNSTFGGTTQDMALVTAEDHERLLTLGRQQVLQHARDTLLHQLSGDQFLVPGSIVIVEERPEWTLYSAFVGDTAESVSLDLRARVQAVIVDERQARQIAYSGLAPYIQPGLEVSQNALTYERGEIEQIEPNGRVTFLMIVKGNIAVSVDEDAVRQRVTGMTISKARRRLENELVLDPDYPLTISTWPGWFNRLPLLSTRITVQVRLP
ncbi:MAG: baseplate J/gp47 family protein [Anaerolineae bacterium]|nr:baseplate J/gp47 family protein [Anaerolineae bacterium]